MVGYRQRNGCTHIRAHQVWSWGAEQGNTGSIECLFSKMNRQIDVRQVLLGAGFTWLFATVFCKLSILWFYTCIFTTKRFKLAARILMFIVSAYGISFLCVFFTNCHPVSYSWNPVPGGHCRTDTTEETLSVSINMVIDTAVVILPMPPLWGLQMATRKKAGISFLFGLGLL